VHRAANSVWLKMPNAMYFADKKMPNFQQYYKITRYCHTNAKLKPKLNLTA